MTLITPNFAIQRINLYVGGVNVPLPTSLVCVGARAGSTLIEGRGGTGGILALND